MRKEISKEGNWIIEFETNNEKFFLHQMNEGNKEEHGFYDSYENAQKAIDRAETIRKRKVEPLPFIKRGWGDDKCEKGKITSLAEGSCYSVYVWVSVNGIRGREAGRGLLKDTIANEEGLERISQLKGAIRKEEENLVHYTEDEIKRHFGEGQDETKGSHPGE